MKKLVFYRYLLAVALIIPTISVSASQLKDNPNSAMQKIQGAFAFPIDNAQTKVRINVNPNGLAKQERSIAAVMAKLTVVACVAGNCQFAVANYGLGFFEANFQLPTNLVKAKQFDMLVVACSSLGCTKATLKTKIINPQDKWPQ